MGLLCTIHELIVDENASATNSALWLLRIGINGTRTIFSDTYHHLHSSL